MNGSNCTKNRRCKHLRNSVGLFFCFNPRVDIDVSINPIFCINSMCCYFEVKQLDDDWKELRAIAESELKDRREKENELIKRGHTSHISAYPFINDKKRRR